MTKEKTQKALDALEEIIGLQDSALSVDIRSKGIKAIEDNEVKQLCERVGYGAVMDSASRQWHIKNHGAGLTTYHCYSVVKSVTEKATSALETIREALKHLKEGIESEQLDENGLKPCPFCGGGNCYWQYDAELYGHIECMDCYAQQSDNAYHQDNIENAIKAWNTRAQTETLKKLIEE
ncbi:MAG: hypothetical protein CBC71_06215 [Rhodobacteraceae bacterium TMED111]|nr:hypothetical protein [Marinovum sp.]OUV41093.1 MAG: hypothetical protein CBC71_06215 [Rhodobacteraceae bacterium TMED111]|tara:strand:- start:20629 stop:21165 length:537 start_codon:yes stop_codon:yes gene_type:complete